MKISNNIIDITLNDVREICHESNFYACRITDIDIDIPTIQSHIKKILEQHPAISKDRQSKYTALGLQYIDRNDSYYDTIETTRYIDENHISKVESHAFSDWFKWNNAGELLKELYKPLKNINVNLYRTRLLCALPGCVGHTHIDYDYRYHVPVKTNEQSTLKYFDGKTCVGELHFPLGYAYVVNAGFMHNFYNSGNTTRIHYCGIMSLPCKGDGKFEEALKKGNKKNLNYVYT